MRGLLGKWKVSCDREAAGEPAWRHILESRGFKQKDYDEYLDPSFKQVKDPNILPGVTPAAKKIVKSIINKEPILVYGDYDVDGISGTSILVRLIKTLDSEAKVEWVIPLRSGEGYGLHKKRIEEISKRGFKVLVTVDCGITGHEEAEYANSLGLSVIITDHHVIDRTKKFNDYVQVVHPQIDDDCAENLCGAAVAWKLAWEITRIWKKSEQVGNTLQLFLLDALSMVALATIADVMPLIGENRSIVSLGLRHLPRASWIGIESIRNKLKIGFESKPVTSRDISFNIAPLINAIGRLGDAAEAVELFVTDNEKKAKEITNKMYTLNNKRRSIQNKMILEAESMASNLNMLASSKSSIVIYKNNWNPGLMGIVAGRLTDKYNKPAFIMSNDQGRIVGSARGTGQTSIYEILKIVSPNLIKFGGHKKAGGFSLLLEKKDIFIMELEREISNFQVSNKAKEIHVDCRVLLENIHKTDLDMIDKMRPFGEANREPVVCIKSKFPKSFILMGQSDDHIKFHFTQGKINIDVVWFNCSEHLHNIKEGRSFEAIGSLGWNIFRGKKTAQFQIQDIIFLN